MTKKHERSNLPIIWQPLLWPIVALYAALYAVCWVRAKWAGE